MKSETARTTEKAAPDYWKIGPVDAPVIVENAAVVLPYLPYFLVGWDIRWKKGKKKVKGKKKK